MHARSRRAPYAIWVLLALGLAAPAEARTVNFGATIERSGETPQPLPRDAKVRVRDAKAGKLVGKGTIKKGGTKPAAIDLPPGEYDVDVYTNEVDLSDPRSPQTTHYGSSSRVKVTRAKGTEGQDVNLRPLSRKELLGHRKRIIGDDIQGVDERIAINKRLRDAKKKVDEDAAEEHQRRIGKLEKTRATLVKSQQGYQDEIDEIEKEEAKGGKGGRAPKAAKGKAPPVRPDTKGHGSKGIPMKTSPKSNQGHSYPPHHSN